MKNENIKERQVHESETETARRPDYQTTRRPDGQTARRPDGQTARRPDGQTARRPDGQTARRPDGQTARQTRICGKTNTGDGTASEKKRKTKAEMDRHRNSKGGCPRQNWLEENCVCRSDPTTWEQLEEEEAKLPGVPRVDL